MVNVKELDIVILWVDESAPGFREQEKAARDSAFVEESGIDLAPERNRNNGELRYVLRSIEQHIPWFRHIYIVTNGQRPEIVDFSSGRVSVISHAEIFDEKGELPCFNTFAIESYVHRIPGLSEWFLRFSDDFFVGRPLSAEEIFGKRGYGCLYFVERVPLPGEEKTSWHARKVSNAKMILDRLGYYPLYAWGHVPQLRSKTLSEEVISQWPEAFSRTRKHQFRSNDDAIMLQLYPSYILAKVLQKNRLRLAVYRSAQRWIRTQRLQKRLLRHPDVVYGPSNLARQVLMGSELQDWKGRMARIEQVRPRFFNLNDGFGESPNQEDLRFVTEYLETMFPMKASFEIPSAVGRGK
jgi:hypothetical protein